MKTKQIIWLFKKSVNITFKGLFLKSKSEKKTCVWRHCIKNILCTFSIIEKTVEKENPEQQHFSRVWRQRLQKSKKFLWRKHWFAYQQIQWFNWQSASVLLWAWKRCKWNKWKRQWCKSRLEYWKGKRFSQQCRDKSWT